jgi:hypothetical protein
MGKKDHRFQYLRRKAILSTILADVPAADDVLPLFALCTAGDRMAVPLSLCLYSQWQANESARLPGEIREEGEAIAFRSRAETASLCRFTQRA